MKRLLVILMILTFGMTLPSYASENDAYADKLKMIEVFKGSDSGYELDRQPTRLEGLIMFVRLLGAEKQVTSDYFEHPFTDVPQWADGYVGWAYENGYTKGISATEFGVGNVDAKSYLTFMLRALGYDDSNGDFSWSESIEFSHKLGIISEEEVEDYKDGIFLRDHVAKISFDILQVNMKDGVQLGQYLVDQGSIEEDKLSDMGITQVSLENVETIDEKYDSNIFIMRAYNGLEIAEFIKGSMPYKDSQFYTYDNNLNTSKILEHGQSNSLFSKEFELKLSGLDIVRGYLFEEEEAANLGAVNLRNSGMNIGNIYTGDYYVDDYLYYIRKEPQVIRAEDRTAYVGIEAYYESDDIFFIGVNTAINEDMEQILKELINNIISNNQKAEEISDFILSEVKTRFKTTDSKAKFSAVKDNTLYSTEMYIDGYFVSFNISDFEEGDLESLEILIK